MNWIIFWIEFLWNSIELNIGWNHFLAKFKYWIESIWVSFTPMCGCAYWPQRQLTSIFSISPCLCLYISRFTSFPFQSFTFLFCILSSYVNLFVWALNLELIWGNRPQSLVSILFFEPLDSHRHLLYSF